MDVTFTNVLEGARQYFQGLPTATSSTAGPQYQNPADNNHHLRNETEQGAAEAVHPPPAAAAATATSAAYWAPPPPASQQDQHHSEAPRPLSHHYQAQQFQFSRPQSREAPSNQYHVQQQPPAAYPPQQHVVTQAPPYHQNVGYYHQQQQQYYPQSKPTTSYKVVAPPPPPPSQPTQAVQENPYYKHLYATSRPSAAAQYPKVEQQQQTTSSQSYRTTHNLPPIASLSLISYQPRGNIRPKQQQQQPQQQQPKATSASITPRYEYQYQNRVPNQSYYNVTSTAPPQVMTTSSSNYTQSSQYYQKPQNGRCVVAPPPPPPPPAPPKRESPLDLSVKTVRTPADSTLDDADQKYYARTTTTTHNYPTYDVYANSFQRNLQARGGATTTTTAPKVEFHPNFGTLNYRAPAPHAGRYPTVTVPTVNSYLQTASQSNQTPPGHGHKTSALYPTSSHDIQKKRPADTAPSIIPSKITNVDTWRQNIDQQIEQRLSSYKQQQAKQNGGYAAAAVQRGGYAAYPPQNHTQTYVPSAGAHQYPYGYPNQVPARPQSKSSTGADKRVLNLLRNSLEIKGAQKKLEEQMSRSARLDVQHPSTDVTAPLQPKPAFTNRQNVSPFTPTNLPDNNNTMYKLHLPKAIDSVNFESDPGKYYGGQNAPPVEESHAGGGNHHQAGDYDGLAALVAARIRTKAELKQVSSGSLHSLIENQLKVPVKQDPLRHPPRRRLFSRSEEEGGPHVPPRDKTGLRSSSETSVFDFPDTDSEGEMPVLERQSLEDMRRDRRSSSSTKPKSAAPEDEVFTQTCDNFMEQLKAGFGKKRGRRKRPEEKVVVKEEAVEDEEAPLSAACKKEAAAGQEEDAAAKMAVVAPRPARKPAFGDGSHFYPGWEEEVYKYKKSLRMPARLIQVTRPPQYHRLSTSLPDLDPYPASPHGSVQQPTIKTEDLDSDTESNVSFKLFGARNYDSEGSSSIKSSKEGSIVDHLLMVYGERKKKKHKRKDEANANRAAIKPEKASELEKEASTGSKVSLKEVFGEDRPASAPPVTCVNHVKIKEEDPEDNINLSALLKRDDARQVLKNKLLNRGRKENLLKTLADKKIKTELLDEEDEDDRDSKSETISLDGDETPHAKKHRSKIRSIRRKFSSGFDYIRKKKKTVKKENQENEEKIKVKKRAQTCKGSGSVQDIQKEIKGWVLNKGIGETILHRSARLGYTDITAYCLEKEYAPSPKDNAGYTPLHWASTKGHLSIARMLLMYGANVSESARGGVRPLHEAVENGYIEVVRLLLSYGADPVLATYSGMTPMNLCADDTTSKLLQEHINDREGNPTSSWEFPGPASTFELEESGFDVLADEPAPSPMSDEEDVDFEVSDYILPNLYTLRGESSADRWVLLQDLSSLLKIKSRDALLRQICPLTTPPTFNYKSVLRELKMSEFLEQAHCCQFLNIGEKVNTRASKIALVKYTDKVKQLLNVEMVSVR